jgi:hypothetical protein
VVVTLLHISQGVGLGGKKKENKYSAGLSKSEEIDRTILFLFLF